MLRYQDVRIGGVGEDLPHDPFLVLVQALDRVAVRSGAHIGVGILADIFIRQEIVDVAQDLVADLPIIGRRIAHR
jgi:hypothetical protein